MVKSFVPSAVSLLAFANSILAAPAVVGGETATAGKSTAGFIGESPNAGTHESGGEQYIVLFKPDNGLQKRDLMVHVNRVLSDLDLTVDSEDVQTVFNGSLVQGFSASMKQHCLDALDAMDDIEIVEKVQTVSYHRWIDMDQEQDLERRQAAGTSVNQQATWGLQAISSSPSQITQVRSFTHPYTFAANSTLGQGVDVYVLDTGVNTAHEVFGNRAAMTSVLQSQIDDEGHGTHVAGTIAGETVGVAPQANVQGIKILNSQGAGNSMQILQGMEAAFDNHMQRRTQPGFAGSVVNLSLGAGRSQTLNNAVKAMTDAGMHVVVSAGNEGADACQTSPASAGGANGDVISVGSFGPTYQVSRFSNTGTCVDVYGPGEQVVSSWITSNRSLQSLQGTSMSAPHVAGLVAYYASADPQGVGQNPAAMKQLIIQSSITGAIQGNSGNAPAIMVNNGNR